MSELAVIQQTINTLFFGGAGYAVYDFVTSDRPQNFVENIKLLKHLNPWQKQQYPQRMEAFTQAQQKLQRAGNVLNNLTDAERGSPASWLNQGFSAYMNEVIEDKVELLRNALLNGLYGDFSIELREDLFKLVQAVHPMDILILKYLINHPVVQRGAATPINSEELVQIGEEGIQEYFPHFQPLLILRSLDRLRQLGIICNPVSMMDLQDPYQGCFPNPIGPIFLDFITDPSTVLEFE